MSERALVRLCGGCAAKDRRISVGLQEHPHQSLQVPSAREFTERMCKRSRRRAISPAAFPSHVVDVCFLAEGLAFQVLHDEVRGPLVFADVVQRADVQVVEL